MLCLQLEANRRLAFEREEVIWEVVSGSTSRGVGREAKTGWVC